MLSLPPESYAERRARLLDALPDGAALLLPTNQEHHRNGDVEFPFRPDSDFYYVTGFDEPAAWALLRKGDDKPAYTLFVQPKDREREVWTGIRTGVEGATERLGADAAHSIVDLDKELSALLEGVESLYFAFGRHPSNEGRLHTLLGALRTGRKLNKGPSSIVDPGLLLTDMRLHKSDAELALMRQAASITAEAHIAAMRDVRPGMHEYEVQAQIEYTFRRRGAWGWAYPSIVAAGANGCILHYRAGNTVLGAGELMLVDAGAEVDGYAADVTRTSPVSGRFTGPQRDLYQLVLHAQERACAMTAPGVTLQGIHDRVVEDLTGGLIELGLLKGSVEENIESKAFKRYYMHRTSHWLGMDVHDVGRYQLRDGPGEGDNRPLAPGMVFTIEPGLYVAPDDEEAPEAFRGIGIRIEDDVLVTEDGHENLTEATPKSIEDVEALQPQ